MRELSDLEQANATYLAGRDIEFSFLLLTATGWRKSIMDAIAPLREFLLQKGIHDYATQAQGQEHKVCIEAVVVGEGELKRSTASLYRPQTKKGDPRIWFAGLKSMIRANEMLVVVAQSNVLYALNLSVCNFQERESSDDAFASLLGEMRPAREVNATATELLAKLHDIARSGYIPAECSGSTAIGRTLETALGLQINSSPLPDYKGIELKSKRRESNTRKTLFAKVPDWELSSLNSFRELIDAYGYDRDGLRRLNCTVNALRQNPGVFFLLLKLGVQPPVNWLGFVLGWGFGVKAGRRSLLPLLRRRGRNTLQDIGQFWQGCISSDPPESPLGFEQGIGHPLRGHLRLGSPAGYAPDLGADVPERILDAVGIEQGRVQRARCT